MGEHYRTAEATWRTMCGRWGLIRSSEENGWYLFSEHLSDTDPLLPTGILDYHVWPTRAEALDDLSAACASVGVEPPGGIRMRISGWWTVDGAVYLQRSQGGWAASLVHPQDPRVHRWSPHRCDHRSVGADFPTRAAAARAARLLQADPDSPERWSCGVASLGGRVIPT